jgi:hypothetical protein
MYDTRWLLQWVCLTWLGVMKVRSETFNVSPSDCDKDGDCRSAIAAAVHQCTGAKCQVLLAAGRYRLKCPVFAQGGMNYGYIKTPGAVELSNKHAITFGGVSPDAIAYLDIDYQFNGCPAISASDSEDLTIQNVVMDTTRLPFTDGTITSISNDRLTVQLKTNEPERNEWNVTKYPFLQDCFTSMDGANDLVGFTGSEWDPTKGIATLHYTTPRPAALHTGNVHMKHFVNMQSWGVYGWRVKGTMALRNTTLLSCAGMGFRCDFCEGDFVLDSSAIRPGEGRLMSSTADGVHLMHHKGRIILKDSLINGTGDDCFNPHGNFIILSSISADRRTVTYIDETGPGWIPQAALQLIGDRVRFYNRLTLQQVHSDSDEGKASRGGKSNKSNNGHKGIKGSKDSKVGENMGSGSGDMGEDFRVVNATGGYGTNATVTFDKPIPVGVLRYDMFFSQDRVASLDVDGCSFLHGGRGIVMSVGGARIANSYFHNGGRDTTPYALAARNTNSILALNGGCGAYEDYTEGPFSRDVLIENNTFDHIAPASKPTKLTPTAIIQFAGCRPIGSCADTPAPPPDQPYPLLPCELGGSTQPALKTHTGDDGPGGVNGS